MTDTHDPAELPEALIPILMRFGSEFDPVEHPETVNPITDTALDAIETLIAQATRRAELEGRLDELKRIDQPLSLKQQLSSEAYRDVSLDEYISKRIAELNGENES